MKNQYQVIIGLEVHIELMTKSKMFCSCSASSFQAEPNTHVCPVCLGLPGALPYPNKKAIEWVILIGKALNCQVQYFSKFDRKNYFYPDLPKGYQISQYDLPLACNGEWRIENGELARIRRVHLEEDTGKLIHQPGFSLIDFNRSGVPLVEVVTEPDFKTAAEVKSFLQQLQQLVRYLGVSQADMEKGQMRCEPNVNLEIFTGEKTVQTPIVEIKNINSFRFVSQAIEHEIKRQFEEFQKNKIEKSHGSKTTRGWDEKRQVTFPQRKKEESEDYRYFPEPDIPPMRFTKSQISNLKSQVSELPQQKLERFLKDYGLTQSQAQILTETKEQAGYFEEAVKESRDLEATVIANWIVNKKIDIKKTPPSQLIQLILQKNQTSTITEEELVKIVKQVIAGNKQAVADFKKGKTASLEFLVGQVARVTKSLADPNLARKLLQKMLSAS